MSGFGDPLSTGPAPSLPGNLLAHVVMAAATSVQTLTLDVSRFTAIGIIAIPGLGWAPGGTPWSVRPTWVTWSADPVLPSVLGNAYEVSDTYVMPAVYYRCLAAQVVVTGTVGTANSGDIYVFGAGADPTNYSGPVNLGQQGRIIGSYVDVALATGATATHELDFPYCGPALLTCYGLTASQFSARLLDSNGRTVGVAGPAAPASGPDGYTVPLWVPPVHCTVAVTNSSGVAQTMHTSLVAA